MSAKGYQCAACGKVFPAIESEWVRTFDAKKKTVLWACPNCGRLQKDTVRFLHDEELDYKPGKGER